MQDWRDRGQEGRRAQPREGSPGLWDLLEEKAAAASAVWGGGGTTGGLDLWQSLQQRLDLSRRRPKRIPEYEVAHLGVGSCQEYYVLKNPADHTYVRCAPQDFFLWERMDGRHSVRDLAVAYFAEFGSFPFERLVRLIARLDDAGFLEERLVHVFDALSRRFEGHSWAQRLNRWANALMHLEFRIRNPDSFFDGLYRHGGWVFFSSPVQVLCVSLILIGLALFLEEFYTGAYSLLKAGDSYGLGLLLMLLTGCVLVPVHEGAHALACKHYGREVLGAGAMLYYGSLVFFVDTSDMWLAPKEARIAVSWSGPFSTVLVASASSMIMALLPASSASSFLFKVAFLGYLSALMNLNPLLEWDGYLMLMDYLEIPCLRQKALGFVKGGLLKRSLREWKAFSRMELIFAAFGLLSALWTIIALLLGLRFVQHNLMVLLRELQTGEDVVSIVVVGAAVLIYGLPLVGGLVLKVAASALAGAEDLSRRANAV